MNTTLERKLNCFKCGEEINEAIYNFNGGLCDRDYTWSRINEDGLDKAKTDLSFRISRFKEICPIQYQENDHTLIPEEIFNAVFNHGFSSQGLLLMGASKTGKTTSLWRLLEKLYIMKDVNFEALTEPEFSQECERHIRNRTVDAWVHRLINIPLLFLDDIGHSATSSKNLEKLYHVVEKRTSWKRPIFATTQFTESELQDRAKNIGGQKTVIAILNRLKISCKIVLF